MTTSGTKSFFERVSSELVVTDNQIDWMRYLRNASIGTFSHDNNVISEEVQHAWWVANRGFVKAWLYLLKPDLDSMKPGNVYQSAIIGYGLVRRIYDGTWWNSLAVLPAYRGKGLGSFITADLVQKHEGVLYASVLRDNPAGLAMHHNSDWEIIDGPDTRLIYFRTRPRV